MCSFGAGALQFLVLGKRKRSLQRNDLTRSVSLHNFLTANIDRKSGISPTGLENSIGFGIQDPISQTVYPEKIIPTQFTAVHQRLYDVNHTLDSIKTGVGEAATHAAHKVTYKPILKKLESHQLFLHSCLTIESFQNCFNPK